MKPGDIPVKMRKLLHLALVLFGFLGGSALLAQNDARVEQQFQSWLINEIWPQAKQAGVSRKTFRAALDGVRLNWELPDLVPPGSSPSKPKEQHQSEFSSPAKYFKRGSVDGATSVGRQMARLHKAELDRIERQTGVPGRIILAIWGRESAYGRARIPHDAFEVLATKAFMSTRADYFRDELIAALRVAEASHVPPRMMKSSWAGALGQPQFMPSNVLKYASDGDGDGRADIWGSEADTIASIGAYLHRHGWQADRDWGFEVTVPASLSCTLEGPDQGRPIVEWAAMGIRRVTGRPFPQHELSGEGYLLMPAGRHGPAFVVTPNFYVLKDYNMSDLYALFVGHIGDRIAFGLGDFSGPWNTVAGLLRSDVAAMQRHLERAGHDVGGADGLVGYKTRRSIGRWQEARGDVATCFPEPAIKAALLP